MPCYRPRIGYFARDVNPSGKRSIISNPQKALSPDEPIKFPCGNCMYCRLEHSRNWAIRAVHEASLYPHNCFLTLTYSDSFLPRYGSLDYDRPVAFMKALRNKFGSDIRSFGCAEYGEKLTRPHYHICLFNFDFLDKKLWSIQNENSLYISEDLQDLWPDGHSTIGDLTFESAAYVARYVTKKITGKRAENHYESMDQRTGEIATRLPERSICVSRMPGLGRPWFEQNVDFIKNWDYVISCGKKVKIPKYYDRLLEKHHPESYESMKQKRKKLGTDMCSKTEAEDHAAMLEYFSRHNAMEHDVPAPKSRLSVMEDVHELKLRLLKRGLENG